MNYKNMENDKLEHLFRRAHPSEPSTFLKERITSEAKKIWKQSPMEIPWQIPVRRLIASAAAVVLIISITNFSNNLALKKWHSRDIRITKEKTLNLEVLPDIPSRSFVKHLVSVNRRPSMPDASALRDYTERVRQILNEMQQHGVSNRQVPNGGRSRLFPVQPGSDYYS